MRSSTNAPQVEPLKAEYLNAKKARKKAKANYKEKLRELKSKLKPFKKLLKEAEKAEKLARSAYKAAAKPEVEEEEYVTTVETVTTTATAAPAEKRKRGRQPGYSPKAAKAAAAGSAAPAKPTIAGEDDLTQVKGVGENIAVMLRANGIKTYADMANTSFAHYKELLKANGMSKFRDPSEWATRAAALANLPAPPKEITDAPAAAEPTEKRKRGRQPGYSPKAAKAAAGIAAPSKPTKPGEDDLTQVKGVGENIAVMLSANGIKTYADMAATSFSRYKELLKANGMSKFRDPSEWAARAAALANLPAPPKEITAPAAEPTEKRKRGRQPGYSPKAAKAAAAGLPTPSADKAAAEPTEKRKRGRQPGYSPKAAKEAAAAAGTATPTNAAAEPTEKRKRGRQPGYSPKAAKETTAAVVVPVVAVPVQEAAPKAPAKPKGPPAKPDDLTQVKGVGQRVAEALNKEGIYTYKDMATVSVERYKEILKENKMSKFRDPSDWARLAAELAGKR